MAKTATATRAATTRRRDAVRGFVPVPYHQDDDETVTCPDCGRGDDDDARFCDQCGMRLEPTQAYEEDDDDVVTCPECNLGNDDDAEFCDQCGVRLAGRDDVQVNGVTQDDDAEADDGEPARSSVSVTPPRRDTVQRDNLVRARPRGVELRHAEDGSPTQLVGYFSHYGDWYEIDSIWEGRFLERVQAGAFARTISEDRASMRVLFDHGFDPTLGMKPLGPIRDLEDQADGPYYVVDLLDTDYNRNFVIPALSGKLISGESAGSQLGASMRFSVTPGGEQWVWEPKRSTYNPDQLPERTITEARVFEFGPVTFPASGGATADARSRAGTDEFLRHLTGDPQFLGAFVERVGARPAARLLTGIPEDVRTRLHARRTADDARRQAADEAERTRRQRILRLKARAVLLTAS